MPTRRTGVKHRRKSRLSSRAIDAWKRADFHELHRALGLKPWQESPLPIDLCGLGVDQGNPPDWLPQYGLADYVRAQILQTHLFEIAGEPGSEA